MLSRRQALALYWICLFTLSLLFVLSPRGCTSSKIEGATDVDGNPHVQLTPEQALSEKSPLSISQRYAQPEIFAEGFSKSDWLFVVFYKYVLRADLSLSPTFEGTRIVLTINMPGQITSAANANKIENGQATWNLKLGKTYKMDIASRHIRWWLIVLTVILVVLLIYSRFSLQAQRNGKDEKLGHP